MTLQNSPFWTVHPWNSKRFFANLVTILNPLHSPNTDGIDPDSTQEVIIQNTYYTGGDDAISIKSGWDCFGLQFNVPSKNILVQNFTVNGGCSGVAIGSEMSGGVDNVTVRDSFWFDTKSAPIKFKSCMGRGAYISNIWFENLKITRLQEQKETYGIYLQGNYDARNPLCYNKNITAAPHIHDVKISNLYYESKMLPAANFRGLLE